MLPTFLCDNNATSTAQAPTGGLSGERNPFRASFEGVAVPNSKLGNCRHPSEFSDKYDSADWVQAYVVLLRTSQRFSFYDKTEQRVLWLEWPFKLLAAFETSLCCFQLVFPCLGFYFGSEYDHVTPASLGPCTFQCNVPGLLERLTAFDASSLHIVFPLSQ